MLLWQVTLVAFIITSAFGLYLFSGYTFRIKVHYPLVLVTCHVLAALVTTVLFSILIFRMFAQNHSAVFTEVFSLISFGLVLLTLISGLYFYLRFDARKRRAKWRLIIAHLVMASLSFIFAVSSISTVAKPQHQHYYPGNAWYKYHLKQTEASQHRNG